MRILDDLFELLSDGSMHHIDSISEKLSIEPDRVRKLCVFLEEYGLAHFDGSMICLTEKTLLFLKEIAEAEGSQ